MASWQQLLHGMFVLGTRPVLYTQCYMRCSEHDLGLQLRFRYSPGERDRYGKRFFQKREKELLRTLKRHSLGGGGRCYLSFYSMRNCSPL